MEQKEKEYIKLKLAATIRKILHQNKQTEQKNKGEGIEDVSIVDSMRQLEAASGLSFTIIQTISAGKRDPQFSTIITLAESLGITLSSFSQVFETIKDSEIADLRKEIEAKRKGITQKKVSSKKKS